VRALFLGAGASKAFGLPLTDDLLPLIVKGAQNGSLFRALNDDSERRRVLLASLEEIIPGMTASRWPSIVDLLSLIDYALAEGFTIFRTGGSNRLRNVRGLLEAALLEVLDKCPISETGVEKLRAFLSEAKTCIITTNYDFPLSRGTYQTALRGIHLAAIEALRLAEEVCIVGYSLPTEDLLVRSIFLRGIRNQPPKRRLQVFQISERERPRYDLHFEKYEYFTSGFDGFLSTQVHPQKI